MQKPFLSVCGVAIPNFDVEYYVVIAKYLNGMLYWL